MPLDPQAKMIIDAIEQSDFELSLDMSPQEIRDQANSGISMPGPEMASVEDRNIPISAGGDSAGDSAGVDLPIRIYKPVESEEPLPGVVFFHGGGWVIGDLESHDGQVRSLAAKTGAIFVAVDYRLAPEHPYPAAPNDCYAATLWVGENAAELGIDINRLAVAGDSAGGNLAAVVSQMIRDKGGPKLNFQLLIYPCCDSDPSLYPSTKENADGPFLKSDMMEWFYHHYVGAENVGGEIENDPYLAPIRAKDLSNLPPALVLTAEYDPLRDEGEAYAEKLAAAGVDAKSIRYDGMFHGFFGFAEFVDVAKQAQDDGATALKKALG